ncbi:NnrS family protein [Pelistega ratti]|nr:NnrS family protein [Pelistega ratti]
MSSWQTFFTHPMRPFFVITACFAIISSISFWISPTAIILHRQIFLEFMLPAAYGGFLMAALLEWTHFSGSLKGIANILGILLLLGFITLFIAPTISSYIIAAYWFVLLLFTTWLIWLDRNTNNFALLLLLSCFTLVQTRYAMTGDLSWLKTQVHLNMAAVMLVSFRVSILLGNEALKRSTLKDPIFIPNAVYKNIAILLILMYAIAERYLPQQTVGFMALAVGLILLAKLRELHHHELLRIHYVRTYYFLQLFASIAYLWLGYTHLFQTLSSTPLHLITIAGIFGGVLMVWLTAGLWHSGFIRLDYPILCRIALPLLFLTALTRTVLMPLAPEWLQTNIPSLLLIMVFVLYLLTFIPIFKQNPFTDDPEGSGGC